MRGYPFCNQTVTLYSCREGKLCRQVVDDAYFSMEEGVCRQGAPERNFLLILPGPKVRVGVGDRVLPGIGPSHVDWETFLPTHIPNLVEVGRTRHYRLDGKLCHVEAEQAWN